MLYRFVDGTAAELYVTHAKKNIIDHNTLYSTVCIV